MILIQHPIVVFCFYLVSEGCIIPLIIKGNIDVEVLFYIVLVCRIVVEVAIQYLPYRCERKKVSISINLGVEVDTDLTCCEDSLSNRIELG